MRNRNSGFTLIEILVALLIFVIMGVMAATSLQALIQSDRAIKKTDAELTQMNLAIALLRRDLSQAIDRSVMNGDGLAASFLGSQNALAFTRAGLINPFGFAARSNMQRIQYGLQEGKLIRVTWDVLDQPLSAKPATQVMLENITSIEWEFIAQDGSKSSVWPEKTLTNNAADLPSHLPYVVLMVMHMKTGGVIQGVFPVPARGMNEIKIAQ